MKGLLFLTLTLFFVSCGKHESSLVSPADPEKYEYEIESSDCSTGLHQYYSLNEICEVILDEELNNNCEVDQRKKLYLSSCPKAATKNN